MEETGETQKTGKCDICGRIRPVELLAVIQADCLAKENQPPGTTIVDIHYCKDSHECEQFARIYAEHGSPPTKHGSRF